MAAFHSITHKILNILLSKTNYSSELDKIHSIATNNGYPPSMIDRMIYKKRRNITLKSIHSIPPENPITNFTNQTTLKEPATK
jgi:hypothetical protein